MTIHLPTRAASFSRGEGRQEGWMQVRVYHYGTLRASAERPRICALVGRLGAQRTPSAARAACHVLDTRYGTHPSQSSWFLEGSWRLVLHFAASHSPEESVVGAGTRSDLPQRGSELERVGASWRRCNACGARILT